MEKKDLNSWEVCDINEQINYFSPNQFAAQEIRQSEIVLNDFSSLQKSHYGINEVYSCKKYMTPIRVQSIENFAIFGNKDLLENACQLSNEITYIDGNHLNDALFTTYSAIARTTAGYAKKAMCIEVPSTLNATSSYFLTHELTHALKERNPLECTNLFTTAEVIPILIELITAYESNNKKIIENVFSKRKDLIISTIDFYKNHHLKNPAPYTISGCYINSFYYALSLFSLYLKYPDTILLTLQNVLNCQLTTDALLKILLESSEKENFDEEYQTGKEVFMLQLKN